MPKLRASQSAAATACARDNKLLMADVGSGKTAAALAALLRKHILSDKRTLVLSSVRICNMVWPDEVATWAPSLVYRSAAGLTEPKRVAMLNSNADIVGLNFENLIWACEKFGEHLPRLFPRLIIDESSRLENSDSKSFQALAPLLPLFEWRLPMTGTPRANHIYDLWGQAYLADLGATFGQYREAFLQKWFYPQQRAFGIDWLPKPGAEQEINERLCRIGHRMAHDGDKPEVITQDINIPMPAKVDDWLRRIAGHLKDTTEGEAGINGITFTHGRKVILGKMLQLSAGFIYADNVDTVHLHNAKLDALAEIVAAAQGEPMMVVYQFRHEAAAIMKAHPQARMMAEDAGALAAWNAGRLPMLLVHPASCGYGLNAQFGGHLQIWFTPTPDAELYTQTTGRLPRPGQRSPFVRILRLVMKGTKDKYCYNIVEARQRGERVTLDYLEME